MVAMDEQITMSAPNRASDSKLELESQYYGFAILWAVTSLWVVWQRIDSALLDPTYMLMNGVIAVVAFCVLLRPMWSFISTLLAMLHIGYAAYEMPFARSHETMLSLFSAALISSYLTAAVRQRRYDVSGVQLFRSFAPVLRLMTVGSLFAIGVIRMNWCFLDIQTSPIVAALAEVRGAAVESWVVFFTMSSLVIVDVFLAIALLIPSLRRFAVGFGCCYLSWQGWMGLGESRELSATFLVGLYFFLSTESVTRMSMAVQRWIPSPTLRRSGLPLGVVVVGMIGIALWAQEKQAGFHAASAAKFVDFAFAGMVAVWVTQILVNLVDHRPKLTWVSLTPRNLAHYLVFAIFVVFVLSPYLGIGNAGRFSSSSGFASTWNRNNHLFLPQATLTRFEQDWVKIQSSNDPYLAQVSEQDARLTWYEFVNYVALRPQISVEFYRADDLYQVQRTGDIEELSQMNPWWLRKLVRFEPLPAAELRRLEPKTVAAK